MRDLELHLAWTHEVFFHTKCEWLSGFATKFETLLRAEGRLLWGIMRSAMASTEQSQGRL